jgi:hypothetical protein
MERLDLNQLVKIREIAGGDVEVYTDAVVREVTNPCVGSSEDGKVERYVESFLVLRFGYWASLHEEQFDQIQELLNENHLKLELWMDDWDDDCGSKVSYRIIDKYSRYA